MKRPTLRTALALGFFLSGGCIDVKEMGDTEAMDDSSGGASSDGVSASSSGSDSQSTSGTSTTDDPTMSTSASGPPTATSTSSTSGTVTSGNMSASASASVSASATVTVSTGDSSGGESSTGADTDGDAEQEGCEASGGTWDETACGHYQCGVPNGCAAVIPGCDCGPAANFGPSMDFPSGFGCVAEDCENDALFDCGDDLSCSLGAEYCEVFVPGVKGAPITYACFAAPNECAGGLDCDCLEGTDVFFQDCDDGKDGSVTTQVFAP